MKGTIPSAEAWASFPCLSIRFLHLLSGIISLRMFSWFIIVTRTIHHLLSVQHSAEIFCMGFLISSSQPSYDVATVITSILQMREFELRIEVPLSRSQQSQAQLDLRA